MFAREHEEMRARGEASFLRDYSWVKPGMSDWTEGERFWSDLENTTPRLKEVYINGGEPMLIRRHVQFLQKLVEDGRSKDVYLTYSINMTKLLEPLKNIWKHFPHVHFACSIDAWDQQNFYIRYPSVWKTVQDNFARLMDWGHTPHVLQTVSALNFHGLAEFYERWQQSFPGSIVAYNDVFDPPWFSPAVLAPDWRKEILQGFNGRIPMNLFAQLESLYGHDGHDASSWRIFQDHLRAFDEMRGMDVREYFPKFEEYLKSKGESLRRSP